MVGFDGMVIELQVPMATTVALAAVKVNASRVRVLLVLTVNWVSTEYHWIAHATEVLATQ